MIIKILSLFLILAPILVMGAGEPARPVYETLVGLPGVEAGNFNFQDFINSLYAMSISIAAILAVIKIIIGGVKYMLTDIVTSKGEAKSEIKGALLGLLVVLGAVLILSVINPQLVNIDVQLDPAPVSESFKTPARPEREVKDGDSIVTVTATSTSLKQKSCVEVNQAKCPIKMGTKRCERKDDYFPPGAEANCYVGTWKETNQSGFCVISKESKESLGCN